jgi:hypothetical protein
MGSMDGRVALITGAQIQRVFAPVEPGAISDAVLFLASDASRHISGVSLPVDPAAMVRWR